MSAASNKFPSSLGQVVGHQGVHSTAQTGSVAEGDATITDRRATDAVDTRDDERTQQALARCHRLALEACGDATTSRHKHGERLPTVDSSQRPIDRVVTEHRPREW